MNNIQSPRTDDAGIEQLIQAKGKTAARVTPADISANVKSEHYFTAAHGNEQVLALEGRNHEATPAELGLLTFCVLVLQNGFTVTGESACASPENFDADIGRKIARENAVQKIWPLMGYELKSRLTLPATASGEFDIDQLRASKPVSLDELAKPLKRRVLAVINAGISTDVRVLEKAIRKLDEMGWHLDGWGGNPDARWALLPVRAGVGKATLISFPYDMPD